MDKVHGVRRQSAAATALWLNGGRAGWNGGSQRQGKAESRCAWLRTLKQALLLPGPGVTFQTFHRFAHPRSKCYYKLIWRPLAKSFNKSAKNVGWPSCRTLMGVNGRPVVPRWARGSVR